MVRGLVPPGPFTVTSTLADPAGAVAVIWVPSALTLKLEDPRQLPPKHTLVVPANPLPLIVTAVPPEVKPEVGETEVTVAGDRYVN
jgi:hypothetical protein